MKCVSTIDISRHNTYEDWICVMEDGSLLYHYELDGWAARRGLGERETPITLEEIAKKYPHVLSKVEEALQRLEPAGHDMDRCAAHHIPIKLCPDCYPVPEDTEDR